MKPGTIRNKWLKSRNWNSRSLWVTAPKSEVQFDYEKAASIYLGAQGNFKGLTRPGLTPLPAGMECHGRTIARVACGAAGGGRVRVSLIAWYSRGAHPGSNPGSLTQMLLLTFFFLPLGMDWNGCTIARVARDTAGGVRPGLGVHPESLVGVNPES